MKHKKTEPQEFQDFVKETQELIQLMADVTRDIHRAISGNKKAGRRARVSLVAIEKRGKHFRKESIKHVG